MREAECVVAAPLPLVKPVRVSGVCVPWCAPLCVPLPVALRQRLGRSPPQRGEEGGGAARGRRRLLLLLLLVAAIAHSYLIAGAGLGVGLMAGGDVWSCAGRRVGTARLWRDV